MFARCRMGDDLAASMARYPVPYEEDENWSTLNDWCWEAEAASFVGDRSVATHARDVLAPYSGRIVAVGAVATIGPVDGYLALVEATLGDHAAAAAHLDAAEALATEWGMTAYVAWAPGARPPRPPLTPTVVRHVEPHVPASGGADRTYYRRR